MHRQATIKSKACCLAIQLSDSIQPRGEWGLGGVNCLMQSQCVCVYVNQCDNIPLIPFTEITD